MCYIFSYYSETVFSQAEKRTAKRSRLEAKVKPTGGQSVAKVESEVDAEAKQRKDKSEA